MEKFTLILVVSFILFVGQSCNKENNYAKIISGPNFKLWKVIQGNIPVSKASYYYYFTRKGGFKIYEKYYNTDSVIPYYSGDVMYDRTWKIKNDQIITIAKFDYKILKISDDTVKLSAQNSDSIVMIRSDDKITIR